MWDKGTRMAHQYQWFFPLETKKTIVAKNKIFQVLRQLDDENKARDSCLGKEVVTNAKDPRKEEDTESDWKAAPISLCLQVRTALLVYGNALLCNPDLQKCYPCQDWRSPPSLSLIFSYTVFRLKPLDLYHNILWL